MPPICIFHLIYKLILNIYLYAPIVVGWSIVTLWSFSEMPRKLWQFWNHDVTSKANQFLFFLHECLPKLIQNWCLQEEERFRNSELHDLLYVSAGHPLSQQINLYYLQYFKLPQHERFACMINTNARLVIFFSWWPCQEFSNNLNILNVWWFYSPHLLLTFAVVEWMDTFGCIRGMYYVVSSLHLSGDYHT